MRPCTWLRQGGLRRSPPPTEEEITFVLRVGVRTWGLSMFAWFFLTAEIVLPLLGGEPVADVPSLVLTAGLQLIMWIVGGFWFGRLLWKRLPR